MRKFKKIGKMHISKKWKQGIGILFVTGLILIGAIATINNLQSNQRVSAHPTHPITLDSGEDSQFELPTDATRLREDQLITNQDFDGYVQNDGFLPNPTKIDVKGFSTVQPTQNILFSEKTAGGNVLAVGTVGTWETGVNYRFTTTFLFLLDTNNRLIHSRQIDGESINQTHATDPDPGAEASSLTRLPDGSFNILSRDILVNVRLNENETRIEHIVSSPLSFQNNTPPTQMIDYNSVEVGLDSKVYYSGHWYENIGAESENEEYLTNGRAVAILKSDGVEERRVRLKYNPCSDYFADPWYMRIHRLSAMNTGPNGEAIIGLMTYTSTASVFYSKIH